MLPKHCGTCEINHPFEPTVFLFYYECRLIGAIVITLGLYMVIWGKRGDNRVLPQEPQVVVLPQIRVVSSPRNATSENIHNFV
jgi:hypothetical protein